jgi:phosphatidylserine/phosphatidylglycerophosphate/cardiolipin synthase-like enzyme
MDDIIAHLRQSIADEVFSKSERKTFRELLKDRSLQPDQLNFLRTKIFELATEKVTDSNYRFIVEWIKNVNSALTASEIARSDAFFSPGDACRDTIIQQIGDATRRIKICVFTISDDLIAEAIVRSHRKGLDIVDDRALITGSYNWTRSAARYNHENILLTMENHVVGSFAREFDSLWSNMEWYR